MMVELRQVRALIVASMVVVNGATRALEEIRAQAQIDMAEDCRNGSNYCEAIPEKEAK